jgi:hypothetical protein
MVVSSKDTGWESATGECSELLVQWGTSLVADENLGLQRDRKAASFTSGSRGSASLSSRRSRLATLQEPEAWDTRTIGLTDAAGNVQHTRC